MIKVNQSEYISCDLGAVADNHNARYEVFCELKSEPTALSGAGRVTLTEVSRALLKRGLSKVSEEELLKFEEEFEKEYLHILY